MEYSRREFGKLALTALPATALVLGPAATLAAAAKPEPLPAQTSTHS